MCKKKSEALYFSLCPYTTKWCFKRKIGDTYTCSKCEVEIKYKEENNMKMINGIQIDKEIREGWTIQDFMNEIDDLVFDAFSGHSIYHTPKTMGDLNRLIENLIPKHIFTSQNQIDSVVEDLTRIYGFKYALLE